MQYFNWRKRSQWEWVVVLYPSHVHPATKYLTDDIKRHYFNLFTTWPLPLVMFRFESSPVNYCTSHWKLHPRLGERWAKMEDKKDFKDKKHIHCVS